MNKNKQLFDTEFSGSTICGVLIDGTRVHCANLGDSRAIKVSYKDCNEVNDVYQENEFQIIQLSTDHKPDLPAEKLRIDKNGGIVQKSKDKQKIG